jgi:hypothetical protein
MAVSASSLVSSCDCSSRCGFDCSRLGLAGHPLQTFTLIAGRRPCLVVNIQRPPDKSFGTFSWSWPLIPCRDDIRQLFNLHFVVVVDRTASASLFHLAAIIRMIQTYPAAYMTFIALTECTFVGRKDTIACIFSCLVS